MALRKCDARDRYGNTLLHVAAKLGDIDTVKCLLSCVALTGAKNAGKNTPLHLAAERGHLLIVEFLLANHADANAMNAKGLTPLHLAALAGYRDIVQRLLDFYAVQTLDHRGGTPLFYATLHGHADIVALLLHENASVNTIYVDGRTPLHAAIARNDLEIAGMLLSHGADIECIARYGGTPLETAAGNGSLAAVKLLLKHGATLHRQGGLMYFAATGGNTQIAELFITRGLSVNTCVDKGYTPLIGAVLHHHLAMVTFLLSQRAEVDAQNDGGWTALIYAVVDCAFRDSVAFVIALLESHADVNLPDRHGTTPLHHALGYGSPQSVIELLLAHGADINAISQFGSPLHFAVGQPDKVCLLLSHGADVNVKGRNGNTPLHVAASNGDIDGARILLRNGADINVRNAEGETPMTLALAQGFGEFVMLIRMYEG